MQNAVHRQRILYIITQGILGGPPTHIEHLASALKDDWEVHVAIGVKGPLFDHLEAEGISVYHIPDLGREINLLQDYRAYKHIVRLIRQIKPDIISTHSSKAGIIGRAAAHRHRIPTVFTAHGWAFTEGVSQIKRLAYIFIERFAARWTDKIICVSDYDYNLAKKYRVGRPGQLLTIHNGVPFLDDSCLSQPELGDPVKLIMVARFLEPKEHSQLLVALAQIKTRCCYHLQFVGDGPLLDQNIELARELGLLESVEFLGSRTDVPELLARAQIFVLLSRWEGLPRSILEAMRAGLPVICSDVGGCGEVVAEGENGFLIPRGNEDLLKQRLVQVMDDAPLRAHLGSSGRKRFIDNFTFEIMLNKTLGVYQEVLKKSNFPV